MGKDVIRKGKVDGLLFFAYTHTYTHTHTNNTKYSILMDQVLILLSTIFPFLFIHYQGIGLDISVSQKGMFISLLSADLIILKLIGELRKRYFILSFFRKCFTVPDEWLVRYVRVGKVCCKYEISMCTFFLCVNKK